MGQHYSVETPLHMNRTMLRILAEGQGFSVFHHFSPFFDNKSCTFPHGLDSLFMWVILCWQMLRVFQSVKLLVSPMDPHFIMRRTTLCWWLIKPCLSVDIWITFVSEEATSTGSPNISNVHRLLFNRMKLVKRHWHTERLAFLSNSLAKIKWNSKLSLPRRTCHICSDFGSGDAAGCLQTCRYFHNKLGCTKCSSNHKHISLDIPH